MIFCVALIQRLVFELVMKWRVTVYRVIMNNSIFIASRLLAYQSFEKPVVYLHVD